MAASYNEKRQEKGFKLFEIGAIHNQSNKSTTGSSEKFHLGIIWYGEISSHWRSLEARDIFRFKGEVVQILKNAGINDISFKASKESGFQKSMKIYSGKTRIGNIGMLEPKLLNAYDLNLTPTLCDLSLYILRDLWGNRQKTYKVPIHFPSMTRDIALQVSCEVPAEDLMHTIRKKGGNTLIDISLFDVYQSEDVGDDNKSLAFSLKFQSEIATLTDIEIDKDVETIIKSLKDLHGANQR